MLLCQQKFSTDYTALLETLAHTDNLLLIQDLDGVCMPLVNDPLTRRLSPDYLRAAHALTPEFYVLTNGEHIGRRGINHLVDNALQQSGHGQYLPGLAAGGVQWQDHFGSVNHPGVSQAELDFLLSLAARFRTALQATLSSAPFDLAASDVTAILDAAILDNPVSPTININSCFSSLQQDSDRIRRLQEATQSILMAALTEAEQQGLADSFFIHYAPNLGQGPDGERVKWATSADLGTTDFQFMLKGAVKEVGVLVILNRFYHRISGHYPLGADFNARQAPRDHSALLQLARDHFDPALMPRVVGVGDTLTSQPDPQHPATRLRGGSDRGFLSLVQALGEAFQSDNAVLFVDSSGGELTRPAIDPRRLASDPWQAAAGITDADDPLHLNFVFPGGYQQYTAFFCSLADKRAPSGE